MNLHHLRILHAVAQRRSITLAAADLLLTQPAVSLQLKALEKELGLPLFERVGGVGPKPSAAVGAWFLLGIPLV
jgi:DNA-binding transcriptional LysR family regulator